MIAPPAVAHLVIGPDRHGVVRHGELIAEALGHRIIRAETVDRVRQADIAGFDVVHLPYTDRLLAARCEDSAAAFEQLVEPLLAGGVAVSVTLHDLPAGDSPLETRRRAAYQRVVAAARGIVVNSRRELGLVGRLSERARSLRLIPLPVPVTPAAGPSTQLG